MTLTLDFVFPTVNGLISVKILGIICFFFCIFAPTFGRVIPTLPLTFHEWVQAVGKQRAANSIVTAEKQPGCRYLYGIQSYLRDIQPFNGHIKTAEQRTSNTVVGTLAADEWAVTFGTARRGLGGAAARPGDI